MFYRDLSATVGTEALPAGLMHFRRRTVHKLVDEVKGQREIETAMTVGYEYASPYRVLFIRYDGNRHLRLKFGGGKDSMRYV